MVSSEQTSSFYCTSLAITDNSGKVYHGRTMEFAFGPVPAFITYTSYYPIGTQFQHLASNGENAYGYTTEYEILGLGIPLGEYGEGLDFELCQGLNSAGLSFSLNMKGDSELPEVAPKDYAKYLPLDAIGHWGLSVCATVDDVREKLQDLVIGTRGIPQIGGVQSPFHFAFYDKQGGSIVVEVSEGVLHVHDNPTMVMTNGPEFKWHLTNLNNYTHLTNKDVTIAHLGNLNLKQPDSGIAVATLPSSDTSVGRFVRGVFYTSFVNKMDDPDKAIIELSHIMNKFDRPKNMTVSMHGEGGGIHQQVMLSEFVVWTALSDLSRGLLYVRSYEDLNYTTYGLDQFKGETKPVHILVK